MTYVNLKVSVKSFKVEVDNDKVELGPETGRYRQAGGRGLQHTGRIENTIWQY